MGEGKREALTRIAVLVGCKNKQNKMSRTEHERTQGFDLKSLR